MDGQAENMAGMGDPATEPIDLAQAFKMYNEANRMPAEKSVDDGKPDESMEQGGNGGEAGSGEGSPEGDGQLDTSAQAASDESGDGGAGGSSDVIEPVDFNARKQEVLRGIQQDAIAQVRKEFSDNKITPCTIEELYNRDEQTGRVTFKNPDDPTHDFASRTEAQQWVDAFNKQIENRFRQEVNKKQQELVQASAPMLRLIEFAPKFNELDKATQDILDDLIEPYAVMDSKGDVIGFNVNLDAALAQAQKIAKRFNATAETKPEANETKPADDGKQATRPAVNMPTGAGKSADEVEPKNIGEALKMYDKMQREKGKR